MLCCIVEDLIEIQDVALLNASEEWTDDVYSLSASVMDGVSICCFMHIIIGFYNDLLKCWYMFYLPA